MTEQKQLLSAPLLSAPLSIKHFLLALLVVAVWGSNFVVIKIGLEQMPPLLFAALRFSLAAFPFIFFLTKPQVSWLNLAAYGLLIGVGQFGTLYLAIQGHITPGLASLVVQTQVFFTLALAMWGKNQRIELYQWSALLVAASGIVIIGVNTGGETTVLGVMMVLFAALAWAVGNRVGFHAGNINMLSYVVWSSAFAIVPLFLLSWWFEGAAAIRSGLIHADLATWSAIVWQSFGNTLFGYAVWAWLLARYPAATITPMALLVPVFGMTSSAWLLGESLPNWKIIAAVLVLLGLALNLLWPKWRTFIKRP